MVSFLNTQRLCKTFVCWWREYCATVLYGLNALPLLTGDGDREGGTTPFEVHREAISWDQCRVSSFDLHRDLRTGGQRPTVGGGSHHKIRIGAVPGPAHGLTTRIRERHKVAERRAVFHQACRGDGQLPRRHWRRGRCRSKRGRVRRRVRWRSRRRERCRVSENRDCGGLIARVCLGWTLSKPKCKQAATHQDDQGQSRDQHKTPKTPKTALAGGRWLEDALTTRSRWVSTLGFAPGLEIVPGTRWRVSCPASRR